MYVSCYYCGCSIDDYVVSCPRCGQPRVGHRVFEGLDPKLVEGMQKMGEDNKLIMRLAEDARRKVQEQRIQEEKAKEDDTPWKKMGVSEDIYKKFHDPKIGIKSNYS